MTEQPGTRTSTSNVGWIVAAVALVAVVVLGALLVTSNDDEGDDETATEETLLFEPAASIGPNAFTAPVTVEPGICDTAALLRELESRPDAYREWAEVLEIPEESVPEYIEGLEPVVLEVDTNVLNHGLRDGQAYPRASTLQAGTAVLVDTEASAVVSATPPDVPSSVTEPPSSSTPESSTPESPTTPGSPSTTVVESFPSTTGPATTLPDGGLPVTRCKCGNPLLPLGVEEFTPGTPDSSPTTGPPDTPTVTTPPGSSSSSSSSTSSSSSSSSSIPDSSSSTDPSGSSSTQPSSGSSSTLDVVTPDDDDPIEQLE